MSPAFKDDKLELCFSDGARFSLGLLAENKKTTDGSDIKIYCFRLLFCAYHEDYLSAKKLLKFLCGFILWNDDKIKRKW